MHLTYVIDADGSPSDALSSEARARQSIARSALLDLLRMLDEQQYDFVTPTPSTHSRIVSRPDRRLARSLRDVFGWNLAFERDLLPSGMLDLLFAAGAVTTRDDGLFKAGIRASRVRGLLFLHSAFPTVDHDAVFLGPDSYRFADLILASAGPLPVGARILDYGAGAGVGGIVAARHMPGAVLTLADLNPKALFLASINAEHAGVIADTQQVSSPVEVPGRYDLIVTHPPFMMDDSKRAYRDGGDMYGARLSYDWVMQGIARLAPGGTLVLHTGVSIVDGADVLRERLHETLPAIGFSAEYRELDPDIFGDELDKPAYAEVDRIAAVGLVVRHIDDSGPAMGLR